MVTGLAFQGLGSSASLGLAKSSELDMLGMQYKMVDFGAEKSPVTILASANRLETEGGGVRVDVVLEGAAFVVETSRQRPSHHELCIMGLGFRFQGLSGHFAMDRAININSGCMGAPPLIRVKH